MSKIIKFEKSTAFETISVTTEDEADIICEIISVFEAEEQIYAALMPLSPNNLPMEEEPLFYHYTAKEGSPTVTPITDDDEYEIAADRYDEMLDEDEFSQYGDEDF